MWNLLSNLFHKIIAFILGLFMVASPLATPQDNVQEMKFGTANTKIRQEINITDAYYLAPANTYATSSEIVAVTDTSYTSPYYYFEVVASTTGATTATIDLVNATSSKIVATITMTGGQTSYARLRSSAFLPNSSSTVEYKVVLNNQNVGKGILASRIVVLQNSGAGDLTNTETQIEIGSATTTATNTTTLPLQSPKYWYYDSNKWDASLTFYVEATYKNNPVASSTTYNVSATATPTFYNYVGSTGVGNVVGEAWGGGGGGDGATSGATIGGGGGGGGTYARATTTLITAGSTNYIGVGRGGAEGTAVAVTASSTLITSAGTTIVNAQGGEGATTASGAATSSLASSVGTVIYAGGKGGDGQTDTDTGGGGGGSAGPNGYGITGGNATSNGPGGTGGNGNLSLGGAGGAGGNGADDTCDTELGKAGVNNVLGAGGGGGADGDVSSVCSGGDGGRPGGGGGGSDEGTTGIGGPGQVKITEWIGTVGIALEESDGTGDGFTGWAYKQMVVVKGLTSTTTERVRSSSFTPTSGRNYRLVASTTSATASYDIYNAKIVVVQGPIYSAGSTISSDDFTRANSDTVGGGWSELELVAADSRILSNQLNFPGTDIATVYKAGSDFTNVMATWKLTFGSSPSSDVYAFSIRHGGSNRNGCTVAGSLCIYPNPNSDTLNIYDGTTLQATTPFTFSVSTQYSFEWIITSTNYMEVRVWETSGSRPSAPTLIQPAFTPGTTSTNWAFTGRTSANFDDFVLSSLTTTSITKLQPQYILANTKLANNTSLQNFLTQYDSSEWSTTNAYITQAEAANGSNSVIELDTSAGVQVTNSQISTIDNRATSSPTCLAESPFGTGTYDTKATTNNDDIYAFRILVDVGSSEVATCGSPATPTGQSIYFFE